MRPVEQLIHQTESALPFVTETAAAVAGRCVVHPPSPSASDILYRTQVTTRSPMGAIAYHTGGISVLHGWLRILGSGSAAIPRTLPDWNEGRADGFYLIADDAFGGFFALDGGAFGVGGGQVCYFSPRSLRWEPLDCGYSQFLVWACSDFRGFYDDMAWPDCQATISRLAPDRCLFFYPPLWSAEAGQLPSTDRDVPVTEAWGFQMDTLRQIEQTEPTT